MAGDDFQTLRELLPLLIPIALLQLGLLIFALYDLFKAERRVKGGSKLVWALIIIFVNLLGPLIYFLAGREES